MKLSVAILASLLSAVGATATAYPNILSPVSESVWTNDKTVSIVWNTTGWEDSSEDVRFFVGHPVTNGYQVDQFVDRPTESGQEGTLYPIAQGNVSFTVDVAAAPRSDFIVEMYSASGRSVSDSFTINSA